MSVQITNGGVLLAGGTGIGKNLILNGNVENGRTYFGNWGYSNASGQSVELIDGKHWLHYNYVSDVASYYGGFYQDHGLIGDVSRIKPNTYYTISATWFATDTINVGYWLHMRSSEGGANLTQYTKWFTIGTDKTRIIWTFNSGENANYTINRFNLMIGSGYVIANADVYFTDVKMEEGTIATPYIPNSNDACYVSDYNGFIEGYNQNTISAGRDYIVGQEFYEI